MPSAQRLTPTLWLVCVIAAIGFAFDTYELLMLPLVVRDALRELGGITPGTPEFVKWVGLLFYVPAVCGGIFGLLGGYLTDRFGRRRVLTWSILLYAISAFLSGYSTSLGMLLVLRTTTFVGVCIEFVAATAWLAELFDDPVQREKALGYTQFFSSFGGLMVAVANGLIVANASRFPAIIMPEFLQGALGAIPEAGSHSAWRYTLMSGLVPALPLIIIRPFLPESPKWLANRAAGKVRRPSLLELFSRDLRRTTILTTLMVACSYGVAFGALQQIPQIIPGLDAVQERAAAASEGLPEPRARIASASVRQEIAANYTKAQETGGLVGRLALALVVVHIASRRQLLRMFLVPGLVILPLVFWGFSRGDEQVFWHGSMEWLPGFHEVSLSTLGIGIFLAGFFTVGVFSFWGNYLPHAYPVHLRGTGESFAANIGGRMLGTPMAWVTQFIASFLYLEGAAPVEVAQATAIAAAGVAFTLILINLILSTMLPEQAAVET
jgi:MFS family permease